MVSINRKINRGGYKAVISLIGTRNGLFYGFPYVALGLWLSENKPSQNRKQKCIGFVASMCLLAAESVLFVMVFKTQETILWISVFPAIYYFASFVLTMNIKMEKDSAVFLRKLSSIIYVSHGLFIIGFAHISNNAVVFGIVTICTLITSVIIVKLSKQIKILRWLY